MKKGLVMEGGAMRGMFTAGVIDVFMENNIEFDGAIGVSAGAVFGCNYKSKQPGRTIRFNTKYCNDPNYVGIKPFIKTGNLYSVDFGYHDIPERLDPFDVETFEKNPMEFYAVCTDVVSGQPIYRKLKTATGDDLLYLQGSASLPLVSKVVEVQGRKLLDGAVSDSVPLKYFESIGYDRNVVILTQPKGYEKGPSRAISAIKVQLKQYPHFIRAAENRHIMYNEQMHYIRKQEIHDKALVIRPKEKLPVNHVEKNPDKLWETYYLGREQGEKYLDKVREFLAKED
jgi:predicted patatin/cPLA2 family phospholipase